MQKFKLLDYTLEELETDPKAVRAVKEKIKEQQEIAKKNVLYLEKMTNEFKMNIEEMTFEEKERYAVMV